MNKTTKVIVGVALVVILASLGFIAGFGLAHLDYFQEGPVSMSLGGTPGDLGSKIDEIDKMLNNQALSPPSESSATAGAIQGLLGSNGDKYAMYFNPKQFASFSDMTNGSFGGIGVIGVPNFARFYRHVLRRLAVRHAHRDHPHFAQRQGTADHHEIQLRPEDARRTGLRPDVVEDAQ